MITLDNLAALSSRRVSGAMSGTSMDSIDVAICRIQGAGTNLAIRMERFASVPYPEAIAARLRQPILDAQTVAELNVLVAEAFAAAIASTAEDLALDLVGSHGQTVYHHSRRPGALKATLQIGDGDVIAERLGVPVVSDFRARDIAAGGEGAPLTPYADFILFGGKPRRAVLNLGGIANLTLLGAEQEDVMGFDTGPANAPLDRIALAEFGEPYDRDGERARAGRFDQELLDELLEEDAFLALSPPKSTGTEAYGDEFVAFLRVRSGSRGSDLIRLALEYVVESIARQVPDVTTELILGGGGAANSFLRERLKQRLPTGTVRLTDDYGVPFQAREAIAFAILANDAVCGLPTSLPRVTGARAARCLGKLSMP